MTRLVLDLLQPHEVNQRQIEALPKVTIVISHLNSARTIGKCISNLLNQEYPKELMRIMVVDGGSVDGSRELVEAFHSSNVDQCMLRGCSEAEGQIFGITRAETDIIMLTNSDIYVPASWIRDHVSRLLSGYDLVGGKVFWGGDKYSLAWNMPTPRDPQFIQQQGMGLGFSNCSLRKELFLRSGGIRDMVSQQDTDFAFRAVRRGGKMILDPKIQVYHDHPLRSFKASFRRSYIYARNHVVVMRATYGRIVIGSGHPAMISIGSLIKEWLAINGVRAYSQHYHKAQEENIQASLAEFLLIRLFSAKLAQMIGVLVGALKRNVSLDSVANSHRVKRA